MVSDLSHQTTSSRPIMNCDVLYYEYKDGHYFTKNTT